MYVYFVDVTRRETNGGAITSTRLKLRARRGCVESDYYIITVPYDIESSTNEENSEARGAQNVENIILNCSTSTTYSIPASQSDASRYAV